MSGGKGMFGSILDNVFPRTINFYALINDQCDVLVQVAEIFAECVEYPDDGKRKKLEALEEQKGALKQRNVDMLNKAFSTPMDREEIYKAFVSLSTLTGFAMTISNELKMLQLAPNQHLKDMTNLLREGAEALKRGYSKLSTSPGLAEEDAQAAIKAERSIERAYRKALQELFNADEQIKGLSAHSDNAEAAAMAYVVHTFKYREIYRHLFEASQQLARSAYTLHEIIVQLV